MVGVIIMVTLICLTVLIIFAGIISTMKDNQKQREAFYVAMVDAVNAMTEKTMSKYDITFTMQPKKE
jgi:Na+-transporting NADH:ubiquinone oxidoreductase subunit NqrC